MKTLSTFLFCILFGGILFAQDEFTAPRFEKTAISTSGCYAYLPNDVEIEFSIEYSPDSARVYTGDFYSGDFHYAVIVVKLNGVELETAEDKEGMLVSYLDYLQESFSIIESAGYGMGHTLESNADAVGIIDFWVDEEEDQWSVKGWADGNTMGILFIYGATEYPSYNASQLFLNGFRFN